MNTSEHLDEDSPLARGSEALIVLSLTVMVLVALAAFWAIGTKAYLVWEFQQPPVAQASQAQSLR